MEKFTTLRGVAAPMPMVNIDTDMIIPKNFLKTIKRTGLKDGLFYEMRWTADGQKKDFILDQPAYQNAKIIVAGPKDLNKSLNRKLDRCRSSTRWKASRRR